MTTAADKKTGYPTVAAADKLAPIQKMVRPCIQCGTCTGSCPNLFAMDHTPRQLWRLVLTGQKDEIFKSKTFSLCSDCYTCTLRCPRGLPLTEAMDALKQIAVEENLKNYRHSSLFYESFIRSLRRHGRVSEMEIMINYFAGLMSPLAPFRFVSLGIRLMLKGKISARWPRTPRMPLEKIFQKVNELEKHT
jgi:heterodisulfide reductase subunit C